jgi:hypothetical protein
LNNKVFSISISRGKIANQHQYFSIENQVALQQSLRPIQLYAYNLQLLWLIVTNYFGIITFFISWQANYLSSMVAGCSAEADYTDVSGPGRETAQAERCTPKTTAAGLDG